MIQQSPPWLLLTSIATGPSFLLTWYWRTVHKKRDLDHKERELKQAIASGEQQERQSYELRAEAMRTDIRRLRATLDEAPTHVTQSLLELERYAEFRSCWQEVVHALSAYLRSPAHAAVDQYAAHTRNRQRAVQILSRVNCAIQEVDHPEEYEVAMPGVVLERLDLQGLNFGWVDLENSNLKKANLKGTKLRGAKLKGVDAEGAVFDSTTELDEEGRMYLLATLAHELPAKESSKDESHDS